MPRSVRSASVAAAALTLVAACAAGYPFDRKTADELFADAGADIQNGKGVAAVRKLEFLKTKFPDYPNREGVDVRMAEAYQAEKSLWKAFVEYRDFMQRYPITNYLSSVERHLFEIGRELLDSRSSFLGTGLFRDADDGVIVLNYLIETSPNTQYAEDALRRIAQYKFIMGDYQGAIADYERIVRVYPSGTWRDLAEYRIGIAYLRSVRRADLDRSALLKARDALRAYLAKGVEGARLDEARAAIVECEEKLAESEYRIGEFYRVIKQPFGATLHYKNAIAFYPGTEYAQKAEQRLADMPDASASAPAPASAPASGPKAS